MKIVYIAGYGRSGSTLLDVILSSLPGVFGGGELMSLFAAWSRGNLCSCGQVLTECDVWSQVVDRVGDRIVGFDMDRAESVTRSVEGIRYRTPFQLVQEYQILWQTVIDAIAEVTNTTTLIDSSKTAYAATKRIPRLASMTGMSLDVIHLVRDPRAVIWSRLRGLKPDIRTHRNLPSSVSPMRTAIGWTIANVVAQKMGQGVAGSKIFVRYEDLASQPTEVLTNIGNKLGIDVNTAVDTIREEKPIDCGHGIGGNPMRGSATIKVKEDTEWMNALPRFGRFVSSLTWPLARQYGYRWRP